jgi:hypothetical protein
MRHLPWLVLAAAIGAVALPAAAQEQVARKPKPTCTSEPTAAYLKHKVFKAKIARDYGIAEISRFTTTRKCFVVEAKVEGALRILYFNPVTGEPVDLPDPPKDPFAPKGQKAPAKKKPASG